MHRSTKPGEDETDNEKGEASAATLEKKNDAPKKEENEQVRKQLPGQPNIVLLYAAGSG